LLLLQSVDAEVQDLYREFQSEKENLLDSIRLLGQQMLLKDAVISAFIPQVCSGRWLCHQWFKWGWSSSWLRRGCKPCSARHYAVTMTRPAHVYVYCAWMQSSAGLFQQWQS
jgi:hypothetical protein